MPEYVYHCDFCQHQFSIYHHMNVESEELLTCPQCKSPKIHRIWKATPVHYKGHGFYTTDVTSEKEFI